MLMLEIELEEDAKSKPKTASSAKKTPKERYEELKAKKNLTDKEEDEMLELEIMLEDEAKQAKKPKAAPKSKKERYEELKAKKKSH